MEENKFQTSYHFNLLLLKMGLGTIPSLDDDEQEKLAFLETCPRDENLLQIIWVFELILVLTKVQLGSK